MLKKTIVVSLVSLFTVASNAEVINIEDPFEVPKYLQEALSECKTTKDELITPWKHDLKYEFEMKDENCHMRVEVVSSGTRVHCIFPQDMIEGLSVYQGEIADWMEKSDGSSQPRYELNGKKWANLDQLFISEGLCTEI